MELLTPSYLFLNELIMSMDSGISARKFSTNYISKSNSEWSRLLSSYIYKFMNNNFNFSMLKLVKNSYERAILHLIIKSLQGQPVLKELKGLEVEYFKAHKQQLERHLIKLPYLSLIPLFIFLFPSYLLLMLGPILKNLLEELSN